jgi:serine/threonine protein kinase
MSNEASTVAYDPEERFHEAICSFEQAVDARLNPDPRVWPDRYPDVADRLRQYFADREPIEQPRPPLPSIPGYEVLGEIGAGGMGVVYQARQLAPKRVVAVKMIRQRLAADAATLERFRLEAEAAARLEHPGIVPVYEVGHDADGQPYYAMRFIEGESLHDAVERFHRAERPGRDPGERRLALRQLLGQFVAVCKTLAYAHTKQILHRDLKPGNILLGQYGEALVVDWGLAKLLAGAEAEAALGLETVVPDSTAPSPARGTQTGQAMGTRGYLSPESAAGQWDRVGPASDVYGLGATLYALLTGRAPIQGENRDEVLEKAPAGSSCRPGNSSAPFRGRWRRSA